MTSNSGRSGAAGAPSPFSDAHLASWLHDVAGLEGGADGISLQRIGAGQSNLTYLATDSQGTRVVVRRPPLGTLTASAHDVVREGKIMAALENTDVPVPKIYGSSTDWEESREGSGESSEQVADVPVIAMSAIDGVTVNSMKVADSITPEVRGKIADGLIDAMAAIHRVDLKSVGLDDLASHKPYAPRQLRRWTGQWDKTKTRELPALDELTQLLVAKIPEQDETVLVHGDLHIGNIIADPETGKINAVVDWELTTLGDPLSDIGSLMAYWPVKNGLQLPGFEAALADGFPTPEALAERYLQKAGKDSDRDRQALAYWHVLGLWKVAIIVEGVVRRVMNHPSNQAISGAPTQEMVEWIVNQAAITAREYGF
ncbi:phosphotransferase family protein [uncultured Corynebacterium sp.]|uniref:phosphotransferase family protein n=1 Tax=uncultured Corynebacterium sp. TaxID=159447 RepID=UPI002628C11C|nr:phosphotransferase family protein [uncultured Corynebacterium sp.]